MHRVQQANALPEILAKEPIVCSDALLGKFLINADSLFVSEKLAMFKPIHDPEFPLKPEEKILGEFNFNKSKLRKIKSFKTNSVIQTSLNYSNAQINYQQSKFINHPGTFGFVPYSSINIDVAYIMVSLESRTMERRKPDSRIGTWVVQQNNLLQSDPNNWHDCVIRWNLIKKFPNEEISEPQKPITYYLDNATPFEFRNIIIEAVQSWNNAFEKIGFKNAVICKMEPDDQEYDPDDVDYNMIIWTSNSPFLGYGPSMVNPLTGEIMAADIIIDYSIFFRKLTPDLMRGGNYKNNHKQYCTLQKQSLLSLDNIFMMEDYSSDDLQKLERQGLQQLVLHEVGHTLGLSHNFKGSTFLNLEELKNKKIVEEKGISNSVMDYHVPNIAFHKEDQTDYFIHRPGPYDDWVIEYLYSIPLADEQKEKERLNNIANQSDIPAHAFGNDSDASDESNVGIDPYIIRFDMSAQPVVYANETILMLKQAAKNVLAQNLKNQESTGKLNSMAMSLLYNLFRNANIIAAHPGGVTFTRSQTLSNSLTPRFMPVSRKEKEQALEILHKQIFAPDAYDFMNILLPYMLPERRSFEDKYYETNDPKFQDLILTGQQLILNQLLNNEALTRQVNSGFYGNQYSITEYLHDLSQGIFLEDINTDINPLRQNLQNEFLGRLLSMVSDDSKYTPYIQSAVMVELYNLSKLLKKNKSGNPISVAHKKALYLKINNKFILKSSK